MRKEIWEWVKNNIVIIIGAILVLGAISAIGMGFYQGGGRLLHDLKDTEIARGLITFLVTLTTVLIAIIFAFYAMFGSTDALKDRFTFGMPVLTALIGVLGTILGFYFGQATLEGKKPLAPPVSITAPDTAGSWLKKGVDFFKNEGKEKALAEFTNPKGQFVKDGLSIYVLDLDGKVLASPEADLKGKNFLEKKDADGKAFGEIIVKESKEKGSGSVEYKWENPTTKKAENKTVFFQKVDDMIICAEGPKK